MTKSETIKIQIDDEIIELKGADKEAFLEQQTKNQKEFDSQQTKQEEQKALRVSAYTKLGLTKEELASIL